MMQIWRWGLVAFFFFGGVAFVSFEPTREIWIGQIWIAVSILVAVIYLLVGRGGAGGFDLGKELGLGTGKSAEPAAGKPEPANSASRTNTTAKQLERLEQLRQKGDLTDVEYQAQRDRLLSET
jgi:Short C-terminal domain